MILPRHCLPQSLARAVIAIRSNRIKVVTILGLADRCNVGGMPSYPPVTWFELANTILLTRFSLAASNTFLVARMLFLSTDCQLASAVELAARCIMIRRSEIAFITFAICS